jgi:adenine phosphoribosyltransferase
MTMDDLKTKIRHVPDFPKAGILFYDITTLLQDPAGFRSAIDGLALPFMGQGIDIVIGIESRGFIFGAAVADGSVPAFHRCGPASCLDEGQRDLQPRIRNRLARDSRRCREERAKVLIVDDLLATGGTARATATSSRAWAAESTLAFLIELVALNGRAGLWRDDPQRAEVLTDDVRARGALIVAAAIWWTAQQIVGELRAARDGRRAAGCSCSSSSLPRARRGAARSTAFLVWYPLARSRASCCRPTARLDPRRRIVPVPAGAGAGAHAQWTMTGSPGSGPTTASKLKAATAEQALAASPDSPVLRGRLDAVEREKLDTYQRRCAEYVRIAKALQALTSVQPRLAASRRSAVIMSAAGTHQKGRWRLSGRVTDLRVVKTTTVQFCTCLHFDVKARRAWRR